MDAERDKRGARKKRYFERYSLVIFQILMYEEVDKIKVGTLFPNWPSHFFPKLTTFTAEKIPTVLR